MANVEGAGGAVDWGEMNDKNRKLLNQWMKSSAYQLNTDRTIGAGMAEVVE